MTTDKKPLFDEKEFDTLIPIYTGMKRGGQMEDVLYAQSYNLKRNKIKDFIFSSIRKGQREAVMEITEELLKTEHLFVGNDDFFEGVEHTRKIFKDEIDRIRAKYQEGKG